MSATVERFARHAQLYGVEFVFEAATENGFTAEELGRLARRLAHLDPKWRMRSIPENWSNGRNGSAKPHPRAEKCHAKGEAEGFGQGAICGECGALFVAARSTARYCSPACRQRAHRRGLS
jgi:hypothetical protein